MEKIMKIAITTTGPELNSLVDPRFGRAAYFLIIDGDTGDLLEAIDNSTRVAASQGAGIGAAAFLANKGVQVILTGRIGPKAMPLIEKANIKVISNVSGNAKEALDQLQQDTLELPTQSSSPPDNNIAAGPGTADRPGMGSGCGRGTGGGRRMGGGGGGGGGGRGVCQAPKKTGNQ